MTLEQSVRHAIDALEKREDKLFAQYDATMCLKQALERVDKLTKRKKILEDFLYFLILAGVVVLVWGCVILVLRLLF